MGALDAYHDEAFLSFVLGLFQAVPYGFLLGLSLGLASFGIFGLVRIVKKSLSS